MFCVLNAPLLFSSQENTSDKLFVLSAIVLMHSWNNIRFVCGTIFVCGRKDIIKNTKKYSSHGFWTVHWIAISIRTVIEAAVAVFLVFSVDSFVRLLTSLAAVWMHVYTSYLLIDLSLEEGLPPKLRRLATFVWTDVRILLVLCLLLGAACLLVRPLRAWLRLELRL